MSDWINFCESCLEKDTRIEALEATLRYYLENADIRMVKGFNFIKGEYPVTSETIAILCKEKADLEQRIEELEHPLRQARVNAEKHLTTVKASVEYVRMQKRVEALEDNAIISDANIEAMATRNAELEEVDRKASIYITDLRELLKQEKNYVYKLRSRIERLEGQVERVRGCQRYRVNYHPMAGGTETTDNPDGPYMKADDVLKALAPEKDDD